MKSVVEGGLGGALLDLIVFQIDRGRATEDRHRHPQARRVLVDALDLALEARERPVDDLDGFADVEADRGLGTFDPLLDRADDGLDLALGDRQRLGAARRAEGRKIVWPSRKETWITSVMVLIMVVIAAIFFFVVDAGLSVASRYILAIGQ